MTTLAMLYAALSLGLAALALRQQRDYCIKTSAWLYRPEAQAIVEAALHEFRDCPEMGAGNVAAACLHDLACHHDDVALGWRQPAPAVAVDREAAVRVIAGALADEYLSRSPGPADVLDAVLAHVTPKPEAEKP